MRFADFLKRKKVVVMFVSGGVGEFLFQLDLAKRLESEGLATIFFVKKKYTFFSQVVQLSTLKRARLVSLEGTGKISLLSFFLLCLRFKITLINSFNSLSFGLVSKVLYAWVRLTLGRVIISKKNSYHNPFLEVIFYEENEPIWKRNNRIASYVTGKNIHEGFPLIFPDTRRSVSVPYIHIHPVGSLPEKSYPVKKLIELFELKKDSTWFFTITPGEAKWYLTPELKEYISNHDHVTLNIKYFHASEMISFMTAATCLVTVNTGILWLACMNSVKTVVADTFTDFEWNPQSYENVMRLAYDYDEEGESLHLVKRKHEDGVYFESMYQVEPREIADAIDRIVSA